jgi:hypothetical protein
LTPEPQGHQVTPEVTDYVVVQTGDPYFSVQYSALGVPSVARVGADFDVAFPAQFDATPTDWALLADRNVTSATPADAVWIMGDDDGGPNIPGYPPGTFRILSLTTTVPPAIGSGGHVGQTATLHGAGITLEALLLKAPGPIGIANVVCFEGLAVEPGAHPDVYGVPAAPFSITAAGEVGFRTTITGGSALVFASPFQVLSIEARTGDFADPTIDTFPTLAGPTGDEHAARFSSAGRSAFRSTTSGTSVEGIWYDNGGLGYEFVAHALTLAPGYGSNTFETFKAPAVTSSGVGAFRACVDSGCTQDGVWRWAGTTLQLIAKDNGQAPDGSGSTSGGEFFESFSNPGIGLSGALAFRAVLKTQGAPQGIWRWTPTGSLRRVVRSGDALRGTSLTFASFDEAVSVADSGQIAFQATMSDNESGLFVTSDIGTIVKIAKANEAFTIGGVTKTIEAILFNPGSAAAGNGGFVQQLGLTNQVAGIAYTLTFTDAQQATVLTTLE